MDAGTPVNDTIGAQLNRMSGVVTEKNLYVDKKDQMGKDMFLKMFTEQLRAQNPLNPVSNDQFSQQMAMFSQLEQQMNMNKNLEKMLQQNNNMQIAALQLVGRHVQADRATIYHDQAKSSTLNFKIPADATDLKVQVQDIQGQTVKTINIGPRNTGDVTTKWDGLNEEGRKLDSGKYSYRILAKGADGKDMTVPTKIDGKVNGVTTEKGVTFLLVGDQKVGLNDIETIRDTGGTEANPNAPIKPLFGTVEPAMGGVGAPASTDASSTSAAENSTAGGQTPQISVDLGDQAPKEDGSTAGTETESNKLEDETSPLERSIIGRQGMGTTSPFFMR